MLSTKTTTKIEKLRIYIFFVSIALKFDKKIYLFSLYVMDLKIIKKNIERETTYSLYEM